MTNYTTLTFAVPDLPSTDEDGPYKKRWEKISAITPEQYSSLQILHRRDDWHTTAPIPSAEIGEKDLETQKNAMDVIMEFLKQDKLSSIYAGHIVTRILAAQTWDTCMLTNYSLDALDQIHPIPLDSAETPDFCRAPPRVMTIAVTEDNFTDVALQFARARDMITGNIKTKFSEAYTDYMLNETTTHPKTTASRGFVRASRDHDSAVAAVTRRYPRTEDN